MLSSRASPLDGTNLDEFGRDDSSACGGGNQALRFLFFVFFTKKCVKMRVPPHLTARNKKTTNLDNKTMNTNEITIKWETLDPAIIEVLSIPPGASIVGLNSEGEFITYTSSDLVAADTLAVWSLDAEYHGDYEGLTAEEIADYAANVAKRVAMDEYELKEWLEEGND